MVLISVVAHENEHTINFNKPSQPSRVRLISASFYNSWNVLKSRAEMTITANGIQQTGVNIPPGHYTPESMANKLTKLFNKNDIDLSIETNTSRGAMVILNRNKYAIWLDLKLHELFDIDEETVPDIVVKRFKIPSSLFIHCVIVDHSILNADVTDEERLCAVVGAEGLINSRPLTYQSANPQNPVPLTPNHFLHGQLEGWFTPDAVDSTAFNPRKTLSESPRTLSSFLPSVVKRVVTRLEH